MTLALGIDVGTSGIRTAVVDEAGEVISMARADHLPQGARIDAALWWEAVKTCLARQMAAGGFDPAEISTIAVDGTSGTMVLTDEDLAPVSQALMYNSKGFELEAARIDRLAPDSHITRGSASALGRAMRLAGEAPDACHLLHQADYIAARLTGLGGVSDHSNALKTGFDPDAESWPDWIQSLLPNGILPKVLPVGSRLGEIQPDLAAEFGLSTKTMIHAGTTDSIAAFLAASPLDEGNAVTSIGSTLAIKVLSRKRIDAPEIGLYAHRLKDIWLVGGASNTGGAVLAHYFSVEDLERLSAGIDPNEASDLDYYPLLKPGERFPVNDPNLKPRLTPRPEDDTAFLHGLFEGIARIEAQCYREIEALGGGIPRQIFTAGGAAKNSVLTKIRERNLGLSLSEATHSEAAIGAALCARL